MKMMIRAAIALGIFGLSAPLNYRQDLSKYRNFSLGMSAANVAKLAEEKPTETKIIYERPALIQELTWYPAQSFGSSRPAEPVEKILFSFYDGELYRMLVTYDGDAIKGLTSDDMIKILSAKYGAATKPDAEVIFPTNDAYRAKEKVIARWEDSRYSLNLFRASTSNTFAVVMFAKQLDAQAGIAIGESAMVEGQEAPLREAARLKQVADNLELERQKNIKALRP